ncbi:hypothetical protein QOZ95_000474 [Paenibacillus brasilensis]|uniref:Uncharacterized protein n=1 Tax=Paenibacillus brasilensis TaxID=128574 RepID=A0ABU0KWJ5_9BACL|nr:hypothetical protein [Paenibacillus brasilensis]
MSVESMAFSEGKVVLEKYPHFREDLNVSNFLIFKTKRQG